MSEPGVVLASVVVGGVLSTGGAVWLRHRERKAEAVVLARSLRAEIGSLLSLIKYHRTAEEMRDMLVKTRTTDTWWRKWVNANEDYFAVYGANVSRLGLLPANHAEKVVQFYTLAKGWVDDMRDGGSPQSRSEAEALLEANLNTLNRVVDVGREAVAMLSEESKAKSKAEVQ